MTTRAGEHEGRIGSWGHVMGPCHGAMSWGHVMGPCHGLAGPVKEQLLVATEGKASAGRSRCSAAEWSFITRCDRVG